MQYKDLNMRERESPKAKLHIQRKIPFKVKELLPCSASSIITYSWENNPHNFFMKEKKKTLNFLGIKSKELKVQFNT